MNEHTHKPQLTAEQTENFEKLRDHLLQLPQDYERFTMRVFGKDYKHNISFASPYSAGLNYHDCESVGCAIGHAPRAGIEPYKFETWGDYAARCFNSTLHNQEIDPIWDWCFDATWEEYDNTPQGAGQRIRYMLEFGIPPQADIAAMQAGELPLIYKSE